MTTTNSSDDKGKDLLSFVDDEATESKASEKEERTWRVLIIDDEKDVHTATTFALRNTVILGRELEFHHAISGQEAIEVLRETDDIAVIMLDVVMETPNAGLDLVAIIRNELKITNSRIILRTGQPNQAPEIEVIRDYDINDYKLKSELTQSKLFAALTTAIRSYKQIKAIEAGKKSLSMIVRSSAELLTQKGLNEFAQGVIVHLSGLLGIPPEGLICVRRAGGKKEVEPQIIAAAGHYCTLIDHPLNDLDESEAKNLLTESLDNHCNVYHRRGIALYLGSDSRGDMSCYVASSTQLDDVDQSLLELFCSNISICADNLTLVERLSHYAYFDILVGLPNRNALTEEIDRVLGQNDIQAFSLAMVDIDNFAEINASLGQRYGDMLLKAVGQRLAGRFPPPCTVARVAGDTFAVFGPEEQVCEEKLLSTFYKSFEIGTEEQIISVTSGIVPLNEIDGAGTEVIKDAGIVLKLTKNQNRGEVVRFDKEMVANARERLELLKNLRSAFDKSNLFIVYQPKLSLTDEKIVGFEALIRWRTEDGDLIPPDNFIPLAEQSGLIVRMGEWILRTAIEELVELHSLGWTNCHMSVNLSVAQLTHPDLVNMLKGILSDFRIPPEYIDLEITESIAIGDIEGNLELLGEIRKLGFTLSIDDFGTGFSSLKYLQKMPINRLKIDQSFVHTSNTKRGREIIEMIVHLGRTLELIITAEGVEKEAQVKLLSELECHEVQGFYYAVPMLGEDLRHWLSKNMTKQKKIV